MSSSIDANPASFFVVQTGVVTWEDSQPTVDWRRKTLTVCSPKAALRATTIAAFSAICSVRSRVVYRVHIAELPDGVSQISRKKILKTLERGVPGFSDTAVRIDEKGHICTASALSAVDAIQIDYLTDYRSTVLIVVDDRGKSTSDVGQELQRTRILDGTGITELLDRRGVCALLRALEFDSYAVMQAIGAPEVIELAIERMTASGVRRVHDVRTLPAELARIDA